MLGEAPVVTTLPAEDLGRAIRFYSETLGLKQIKVKDMPGYALFAAGHHDRLAIYEREHTHADHTVLTFYVDDVEHEVAMLKDKGVIFEEYDMPQLKTDHGIATIGMAQSAWFKDPEGNVISVMHSEQDAAWRAS